MQDDILLSFDISSHNNSAATDDVKKSVKMCNFSPFNAVVSTPITKPLHISTTKINIEFHI